MTQPASLTIIIVNWNVCALLQDCLASLAADPDISAWTVIVVDNASTDGSVEMIRSHFPFVTIIESQENLGFAEGCQLGYDRSHSDYVLLLNPDTVVPVGAIGTMLADLKDRTGAAILGSRLVGGDGKVQRSGGGALPTLHNVAWNYLFLERLLPRFLCPPAVFIHDDRRGIAPIGWVSGAAMLLRRAAIGPRIFDPGYFMFGEDMALCARMRQEGWQVLYSGRQTITHLHGQSYRRQSSIDVLKTIYRGPRTYFRATHGPAACIAYDIILLVGYLMRWIIAGLLHIVRPGRGHDEMRRFSRAYVGLMLRSFWAK